MRPDSFLPLATGPLGALFTGLGAAIETSQFGSLVGVLLGLLFVVLLALVASLLGWGIVVLLSRSTYKYNPRVSPAADSVFDAKPVGLTSFFSFAALGSLIGDIGSNVSSTVTSALETLGSNLLPVVIIVIMFAFIFVWNAWQHLFLHAIFQFEANFFLGFWRTIAVPLVAVVAFVADQALVLLNGVRHFVQAGTVVTIEKSLICGFGTLQIVGLSAFQTLNLTILGTEQWLLANGTSTALTRGPDFTAAAAQLGTTIALTKTLADCACEPLSDRLFLPLSIPFTQPAFANAINATLGIAPALVTQVLLRPVVVSIQRALASGGTLNPGDAPVDVVPPSFNATFDLISYAATNWTLFADSFIPALENSTTLFLEDLLDIPLPSVTPPLAGPLTATIGALIDITSQAAKDVLNLLTNAIFNSENVFGADGFLFWRLDDAFEAFKRAVQVVEGYLTFVSAWLRELGAILAANVRKRSEFVPVRALAHLPASVVGDLLQAGFDIVANFVDTLNCFVDGVFIQFGIRLGQLIVDWPVGTVYRAVDTAITNGFPNPLAFSQELWGDDTPIPLLCTSGVSGGLRLFSAEASGCLEQLRFVRFCVDAANDTSLTVDTLNFTIESGFDLFESLCLGTHINTCPPPVATDTATMIDVTPGDGAFLQTQSPNNVWFETLNALTTTAQCTTDFFDNLCTGCSLFGVFLGAPLVNVVVQLILLPLNILIHLDLVLTTEYLGTCVDFNTPLTAIETFFSDLAAAIGIFNQLLTGSACPLQSASSTTTITIDSATIICAFAGFIQFSAAAIVEFVRQVTIAFQTVIIGITALAGVVGTQDFLNILGQIDFSLTLANAQLAILDAVAFVLSIFIPASFVCADDPTTNVRTAFINALGLLTADAILLIPRIILIGLTTIIDDLTTNAAGGVAGTIVNVVGDLFGAVLTPLLNFIGDAFIQFGNVLNCLTAANGISSVFISIGQFLESPGLEQALQLLVEIVTDFIALVVGIIQLLTTGDSTLITQAFSLFTELVGDFFILIFGASTACGIQSALCDLPGLSNLVFIADQCAQQGFPTSCGSAIQSSTGQCVLDIANCANPLLLITAGACPSSPFGCCSSLPGFPANGSQPVINIAVGSTCQEGQFCDERATCTWFLPVLANGTAAIPFLTVAPAGDPDAALGQSVRDSPLENCPRFVDLTNCSDPARVDDAGNPLAHGEIVRARPFGLHFAAASPSTVPGQPAQLLNFDYCTDVINAYGLSAAQTLFAPLRHENNRLFTAAGQQLISQVKSNATMLDLARCYFTMYPENTVHPSLSLMLLHQRLRTAGKSTSSMQTQSWTAYVTTSLRELHYRGRAIYERNRSQFTRARVQSRSRLTPLARHEAFSAHQMQLPRKFSVGKAALASTLATLGLSHDVDTRAREGRLAHSFFNSYSDWYAERIARFRGGRQQRTDYSIDDQSSSTTHDGLAPQLVALLMHFSEAGEHIAYALNYHLNIRSAKVDVFGTPLTVHAEAKEHAHVARHSPAARVGADVVPHPLQVVKLWALERRDVFSDRLHEKLFRLATSADYTRRAPDVPQRWLSGVVYHRQAAGYGRTTPHATQLTSHSYRTYAVLQNDTSLEELLGVDQCSTGDQLFCTGCALLDNLVFAVEQQVNASIDFYTDSGTAAGPVNFGAIRTQFETTIHNTLVDPVGPDTYTTANPRTPFILRRFLTIDWPWFWNYTELNQIVFGNASTNEATSTAPPAPDAPTTEASAIGFSAASQAAIAASQNRTDADLSTLNATSIFVTPIISFLEQLAFQLTQIGPISSLIGLFERYVVCDYERSMFGTQPQSTGLFDAIVITVVGLFVIGLFVAIIPGAGMCMMVMYTMFAGFVFLPLVFWIGYGASPLCTLPSFFGGIPGAPVPFPTDLERLFEELTPECPPVDPAMIDPAAFAAASTQLCGQPGPVPPLIPCSEAAGFIDGFDNIFFSLTGLYGENVTMTVANELDPFAPEVAQVARIYTDAHNNELAARFEIGALCNFLTFGNVLTVLLQIGALILAGIGIIGLLILLIGLLFIAIVIAIYANMVIWLQVRKGFFAYLRRYGPKLKTQ